VLFVQVLVVPFDVKAERLVARFARMSYRLTHKITDGSSGF